MTGDSNREFESSEAVSEDQRVESAAASSTYKVLGEFSDETGTGVLGTNTASSGTPIGVQGAVPNATDSGYGLHTPHDARVEQVLTVGGALVQGDLVSSTIKSLDDFVLEAGTTTTDDARNVVLGHESNTATSGTVGGTVGGGGYDDGSVDASNRVSDDYATVSGGGGNIATRSHATVGGGKYNRAEASHATIAGGGPPNNLPSAGNVVWDEFGTIGGGAANEVGRDDGYSFRGATVSGGNYNEAVGTGATVGGGQNNAADGKQVTVGGGWMNVVNAKYATISGGAPADTTDSSTRENTKNVIYGDYGAIGGGGNNAVGTSDGTSTGVYSVVGGGRGNTTQANQATIGGGQGNTATSGAEYATISGGTSNAVTASRGTVTGGGNNVASGGSSFVGGGGNNEASGSGSFVGGGGGNVASELNTTVAGGNDNEAKELYGTVAGGNNNVARWRGSTVGGGEYNHSSGEESTIAGGLRNHVNAGHGTVSGGESNHAHAEYDAIGGGLGNETGTSGTYETLYATVPGGAANTASGAYSFAAGRRANATNDGTFVWADSTNADFSSTGADQFLVNASGGVGIGTNSPRGSLDVADSASGSGNTFANHLVTFENTTSGGDGDVLGLKIDESGGLESWNHFVTFFDGDGNTLGAIESDESGGVTTASAGGDYAEYLPRKNPDEGIEPCDVVGVTDGEISLKTAGADQVLVVSTQPIVTGNDPGPDSTDREGHEVCAFVGQVPVKVAGPVDAGDVVVPSGDDDGTARAIAPEAFDAGDGPIVGCAWEEKSEPAVAEVTVAVGLETGEVLTSAVARQRETIEALRERDAEQNARIEDLQVRSAALESENERLRERLDALEAEVAGTAGSGSAAPADD